MNDDYTYNTVTDFIAMIALSRELTERLEQRCNVERIGRVEDRL